MKNVADTLPLFTDPAYSLLVLTLGLAVLDEEREILIEDYEALTYAEQEGVYPDAQYHLDEIDRLIAEGEDLIERVIAELR